MKISVKNAVDWKIMYTTDNRRPIKYMKGWRRMTGGPDGSMKLHAVSRITAPVKMRAAAANISSAMISWTQSHFRDILSGPGTGNR